MILVKSDNGRVWHILDVIDDYLTVCDLKVTSWNVAEFDAELPLCTRCFKTIDHLPAHPDKRKNPNQTW